MTTPIPDDLLKKVVALAKRRGFIYPGSEIYGGFANTYSFGPYGAELKRTIKNMWWNSFVNARDDMVGLDGPILLHPMTWKASGHVDGFSDALVDCKACKNRFRIDHLLEAATGKEVEGLSLAELGMILEEHKVVCPKCGKHDWTAPRQFNLMFSTHLSKTVSAETNDLAYLRPETAQAIFLDYRNIIDTMRVQIPFGVAQIGKAFRNEITPGNFIFRVVEFEQMEIEYFIHPSTWEKTFEEWLQAMQAFAKKIGLHDDCLKLYEHPKDKLSHYSKRTVDILFKFPFGFQELWGLAYRTDFDLSQHAQFSKSNLTYTDPQTKEKWIPHVVEPTFGVERTLLALLCQAYDEETLEGGDVRTVLRFSPKVAPVKAAIFPLMKKDGLKERAYALYKSLKEHFVVEFDDGGAIGKRYRRQDEIGTPYCITIDYDTMDTGVVTVRERDSMSQIRMNESEVLNFLKLNI